jgi:hypothetical protein
MATKSFLKNVNIRDYKQTKNLVNVLENAESLKTKEVSLSRSFQKLSKADIKNVFGDL